MNNIGDAFKNPNHKALIPYVTVGYPDLATTLSAVPAFAAAGADIVELGIPFSDPLADGATIQKASFNALKSGVTPGICLDIAAQLSGKIKSPLAFMTYSNPVMNYGIKEFCRDCAQAGISGLIVPDLPPEEAIPLEIEARSRAINLIYFLAPTSRPERINLIASRASGFIYMVSVTGVTGTRTALSRDLAEFVANIKKLTKTPVCVGFGISRQEQVVEIVSYADGVIIGSRIVQLLETEGVSGAVNFVKELREAIDGG